MKKLILLFILLQVSLFANKYIGMGYGSISTSYNTNEERYIDSLKSNIDMYAIYYSNTIDNYIFKASIEVIPSQAPFTVNGNKIDTLTTKGYGAGVSFAYKIFNKSEIFIAPSFSLGYASITTAVDNSDKEQTGIPFSASIVIGMDYKKDSNVFIEYGFLTADLDVADSDKSASKLNIGVSHSINNSFSVQSSYKTDFDNKEGINSSTGFSIGVGYSF